MTLIVAISCNDGIVFASDSASSDPESGTKQLCDKIKKLRDQPILYAGSGDVGLIQKISENLESYSPKTRLKGIRQEIKKLIVPEIKDAHDNHVPFPQMPFHQPPVAVMLFAGVLDRKPWILEIEKDGRDTIYGAELGNFAAIGSGKPLAQAIFNPHLHTPRDLRAGRILVHRVIDDSINLAAAYLAKPIHMYTISLDGAINKINDNELNEIANTCDLWRTLERESLGKCLAPQPANETGLSVPKP
jgi:20S proteasome alpha/beta subunit